MQATPIGEKMVCQRQRYVRKRGKGTYIRSHAGVVLLRGLLLLCRLDATRVWAYYGRSVLEVAGRFVVEGIRVRFLCDHLDVHAGLRVLNDGAQVHLDRVLPFRSP